MSQTRPYTTLANLQTTIISQYDKLRANKTYIQYLTFTSVPDLVVTYLHHEASRCGKLTRYTFDTQSGTLTVKVLPGVAHESAIANFNWSFGHAIRAAGSFRNLHPIITADATLGACRKQADLLYMPPRLKKTAPSLAVEAAFEENDTDLTASVHNWLLPESVSSTVNVVVTLSISQYEPKITFRRWQRTPATDADSIMASTPPVTVTATQSIVIERVNDKTTNTEGPGELTIPLHLILNRQPLSPVRDVIIPAPELLILAHRTWNHLSV